MMIKNFYFFTATVLEWKHILKFDEYKIRMCKLFGTPTTAGVLKTECSVGNRAGEICGKLFLYFEGCGRFNINCNLSINELFLTRKDIKENYSEINDSLFLNRVILKKQI